MGILLLTPFISHHRHSLTNILSRISYSHSLYCVYEGEEERERKRERTSKVSINYRFTLVMGLKLRAIKSWDTWFDNSIEWESMSLFIKKWQHAQDTCKLNRQNASTEMETLGIPAMVEELLALCDYWERESWFSSRSDDRYDEQAQVNWLTQRDIWVHKLDWLGLNIYVGVLEIQRRAMEECR